MFAFIIHQVFGLYFPGTENIYPGECVTGHILGGGGIFYLILFGDFMIPFSLIN